MQLDAKYFKFKRNFINGIAFDHKKIIEDAFKSRILTISLKITSCNTCIHNIKFN